MSGLRRYYGAVLASRRNEAVTSIIDQITREAQRYFRFSVRDGVEQALSRIRLEAETRVVLPGVATGIHIGV